MEPPRVVVVRSRHSPHKLALLGLALLTGVAYLLGAPPPQSLAAQMPTWLVHAWAVGLLLHGAAGFAGVFAPRRHLDRGLGVEVGAMLFGAAALLVVAAASFKYAGGAALLGGGLAAAWAVANVWRAAQIRRDLRQLRRAP